MTSLGHAQSRGATGGPLRKLVWLIAATSSLTPSLAVPQPMSDNLAVASSADLEARAGWKFSCFAQDQACMAANVGVDGSTKMKGSSTIGCSQISSKGCTKYSFTGDDDFKLCLYSTEDCTGDGHGLDGDRICQNVGNSKPGSWKVVPVNSACI
ncbi:hypothetical protein F4779DRAFT_170565 [Xylariaceae sp. FL0662B]|nr:hypothetical protein F4779DRAFT_170565 [Xylariaceae sp. FL0662B]